VLSLRARVVAVEAGRGILGLGVVDGLPPTARMTAAADGRRVALDVGLVESSVPADGVAVGDVVTVIGREERGEPTLQEWADATGTIGEEIAVRLSPRIERRVVDGGTPA